MRTIEMYVMLFALVDSLRRFVFVGRSPIQLPLACLFGAFLAVAALKVSPLLVIGGLIGGVVGIIVLQYPELAFLGILFLTSSIIQQPSKDAIFASDLVAFMLLAMILLRRLLEKDFKIIHTPAIWLTVLFLGLAIYSTWIKRSTIESWPMTIEIRAVLYLVLSFLVVNVARSEEQLVRVIRGIVWLATLVGLAMMAQFAIGTSVQFIAGRMDTDGGVARILPPGQSLVQTGLVLVTAIIATNPLTTTSLFRLGQWCLIGLGVVLTFNRNFWVTALMAIGLIWVLSRPREKARFALIGSAILLVIALIMPLAVSDPTSPAAKLVDATIERFSTLGDEDTAESDSLKWRYVENEHAMSRIPESPWFGIGLGAYYRAHDNRIDYYNEEGDHRTYIHHGHLWIIVKTGWIGYSALLSIFIITTIRSIITKDRVTHPDIRAALVAFPLTFIALMLMAFVNPVFMQSFWTPVMGVMIGVVEQGIRFSHSNQPQSQSTACDMLN